MSGAAAAAGAFGPIIAAAGGPKALARRLGLRPRAVDAWLEFDRIPKAHWLDLEAAGIATAETLAAAQDSRDAEGRGHAALIDALGVQPLAELFAVSDTAVKAWRLRGRIPRKRWTTLIDAGLTSEAALTEGYRPRIHERKPLIAGPVPAPERPRMAAGRARLEVFCRLIDLPGVPPRKAGGPPLIAAHHRLWLRRLEQIERGEITRLMGFMPPGSAKSTYAVDVFTPWFMARAPMRSVLCVTYATSLAHRRGRKARWVARQAEFAAVFGTAPAAGQGAALNWALDNGSDWMGAGILAGITGNRADLIVIDDPVKGRAEADSETVRVRTREEFDDTVRTRLKADGRIVLIQTRWHEDDLAGSLLPDGYDGRSGPVLCRDGEVWEVVNIPAQAERADDPLGRPAGAYLWPEYWKESHWAPYRLNPRTWNALYQQRPKPEEGSYFERSRFRRFHEGQLPQALRYYGTSDYAVSEGRGDYTRLTVWGVDRSMHIWRVASWGGRTASDAWIEAQVDLVERFRPLGGIRRWFGEAGVIQRAVEPMLTAKLRQRRQVCPLDWLASAQDKATRARAAQSLVREGRVWVRDDGDGDCFIEECVAFPAGRHDDEVDCLSLMGRALDRLSRPATGPVAEYAEVGSVFETPRQSWGRDGLPEYAEMGDVFE